MSWLLGIIIVVIILLLLSLTHAQSQKIARQRRVILAKDEEIRRLRREIDRMAHQFDMLD